MLKRELQNSVPTPCLGVEYCGLSPDDRAALRDKCTSSRVVMGLLDDFDARIQEARKEQELSGPKKEELPEPYRELPAKWMSQIHLIKKGRHVGALLWAWRNLGGINSTSIDFARANALFGPTLSEAIKRGFLAFWRLSDPVPPRTDHSFDPKFKIALIGATMEFINVAAIPSLSKKEAEVAAMLAMHDLNRFPGWLGELRAHFPGEVASALRKTVAAEWQTNEKHFGVLRYAPYTDEPRLQETLAHLVLEMLEQAPPPGNAQTLHFASSAISTQDNFPDWVGSLCKKRLEQPLDKDWRIEWLRLWGASFPIDAARWLSEKTKADISWQEIVVPFAAGYDITFNSHSGKKISRLFKPESLEHWIPIIFDAIPPQSDDHLRSGIMGDRDHAISARDACIRALEQDGSAEATRVIIKLAQSDNAAVKKQMQYTVIKQRNAAAEQEAERWTVEKILAAERGALRIPTSEQELHDVVCADIRRVAKLIEEDEFSYAELFAPTCCPDKKFGYPTELTIQRWVASSLKLVSGGVYSIVRENEIKDRNRVDISAFKPSAGRIPIEIKPVGNYSIPDLKRCIRKQLLGKYMRQSDINFGVLLIVRLKQKTWRDKDGRLSFAEGLKRLRKFAEEFFISHGKTISIESIELTGKS